MIDAPGGAPTTAEPVLRHALIIGAGFGGVGLAVLLRRAGIEDFVILERGDDLGGVWRDNTYPGAACDVPSRFYSYSFESDYEWSQAFAPQSEILAYIKHCATKYGVWPKVRLNETVTTSAYDEKTGSWTTTTASGATYRSRMLISAIGLFNRASYPVIEGIESFKGAMFHSSRWDHSVDLRGRRVAVIGTGASAIQFAPVVAKHAGALFVVQRSSQYVMPKPTGRPPERTREHHRPRVWRRLERLKAFWRYESGIPRRSSERLTREAETTFLRHLERELPDERLRARLTPTYRLGCKRVLMSNDWYPMFRMSNVELVDTPVVRIDGAGFVTKDGVHRDVDVIILNTGFKTTEYVMPTRIVGANGVELNSAWAGRPEAYLGMAVKGFPNFFMMYGPNTNSSASIIYLLECQAGYIASAARKLSRHRDIALSVRDDVQTRYNAGLRARLGATVIAALGCSSYFKTASGDIVTQWPGFMTEYRLKTAFFNMRDFIVHTVRP